ncbi:unnamed protein product, partial [Meganyctiphanes norvegica]
MEGVPAICMVAAVRSAAAIKSQQRQLSCTARTLAPAVTQAAPGFKAQAVVNGDFKELSLDDYKGKYLVLFFYPLDFTFVCPTELIAFSERVPEFQALNCEVVGVSTDSHFSHLAWINQPRKQGGLGGLAYPLLADFSKQISRDYGVLLEDAGIALRGLFLIDPEVILDKIANNDLGLGKETLAFLNIFTQNSQFAGLCPANWQPEAPTIKPDPTGSLEYFDKVN